MRFSISTAVILGMLTQALPALAQNPIQESEPNDNPATADTAALGDTVAGLVGGPSAQDSVDYWIVYARAGDTIFAALTGCTSCIESSHRIELLASDGVTTLPVRYADNRNDPQLIYVATVSGTYFIRVTYSPWPGSGGHAPYTIAFVERKCPDDPNESNDSFATATPIARDADVRGRWCPSGDRDLFRIDVSRDTVFEFWMDMDTIVANYEPPDLVLFDSDTARIQQWQFYESGTPPPSHHRYHVHGTFYLEPRTWRGGLNMAFKLHIRSYAPPPVGLSLERAARELLHPSTVLTAEERSYLDHLGNKNGSFDLGDFQVFLGIIHK